MEPEAISFDQVLAAVRAHAPEIYRAWFDTLRVEELNGGLLRIAAKEPAQARYLRDHCAASFTQAAMSVSGYLLSVQFTSVQDGVERGLNPQVPGLTRIALSPDYTFEEFVVGPSNRLAHAACKAASTQPGALYNPLFLHGASGLGKSHLLQATCHAIVRENPTANVANISCETFVNDFVRAIETGRLPAFRAGVRNCDLLVIDDVQFLANRESSQEELFHTFNALHQARRQIILSADSAPSEIPTLEDRLVSRFSWGLVAQIDPPTRETRQAILAKKARLRGLEIPAPVLDLIAERVHGNIRKLEGALTALVTAVQVAGKPMSVDTAKEVLPTYENPEDRPIQISDILHAVAKYYRLKVHDLLGRKRTRSISMPRQIAMYLARRLTPLSLKEIGAHFGGRDHSTVVHAEQLVSQECTLDSALQHTLEQFTRRLSNRTANWSNDLADP